MQVSSAAAEILVLGLGNTLLADDGIGVHVARRLAIDPPCGVRVVDGGTLGFRLLDLVRHSDALLFIDAADLLQPAGTIRLIDYDAIWEHVSRGGGMSAHEAGLVDLLTLARLDGWNPTKLALLAIQPQKIDWDERLSDPLASALPAACQATLATVQAWQSPA
jgi:hydrogenase maturation protease